jgi:hypothetical protein
MARRRLSRYQVDDADNPYGTRPVVADLDDNDDDTEGLRDQLRAWVNGADDADLQKMADFIGRLNDQRDADELDEGDADTQIAQRQEREEFREAVSKFSERDMKRAGMTKAAMFKAFCSEQRAKPTLSAKDYLGGDYRHTSQ